MTSRSQGGQGFCDNRTKALVIKRVTMRGGGVKKCPNLCDVIYGRPLYFYQYQLNIVTIQSNLSVQDYDTHF